MSAKEDANDALPQSKGKAVESDVSEIQYIPYGDEKESKYLPAIRQLISKDLSEPYSIYVYRYFLYQWGDLCFMVSHLLHLHGLSLTSDRLWTLKVMSLE